MSADVDREEGKRRMKIPVRIRGKREKKKEEASGRFAEKKTNGELGKKREEWGVESWKRKKRIDS